MTLTRRFLAAASISFALIASGATARPAAGPLATVRAFADAINKNDMAGAAATFTPGEASIIDEFKPYVWIGPNALKDWAVSFGEDAKATGKTDPVATLASPIRVSVEDDTAYVVTRATFAYTQNGAKMQDEAVWTLVLKRTDKGWLIKAWAWGAHKPKAVMEATPAPKAS